MNRCDATSPYIEWAKTRAHVRFNLATSAVADVKWEELAPPPEALALNGPSFYGYAPLNQRLAAYCGVAPERVAAAIGTTLANHLAMAALVQPGEEVLLEEPAYDPLLHTALFLGARVRRFVRPAEAGFRLELREVENAITPKTRLVVLTNLHNPSSALVDEGTLRRLGELAREAGARVLVDEVYLEAVFDGERPTASRLGDPFVVTSSLTKAFGLGGLRCGWVVGEPDVVRRVWSINDLFVGVPAHPAERLAVVAFDRLRALTARSRDRLEGNRARLSAFMARRRDVALAIPSYGTVVFPRIVSGRADALCDLLRERYETSVVPGRFFERPSHVRIGLGGDPAVLEEGLRRLGAALDELA